MNDLAFLQSFADTSEDIINDGNSIIFNRHGDEYNLTVSSKAGLGILIDTCNGNIVNKSINEFIIIDLLNLPGLAGQISKSIERKRSKNKDVYVEGPALMMAPNEKTVDKSKTELTQLLLNPVAPLNTQIVRLLARAGQGKSFLLEEIALDLSKHYSTSDIPSPLLLPIDLLGRYVGAIEDAIAGSLNNTFNFPRLTQNDIISCIKMNWICLALDGFDELCARIGPRDALYKVTDLLDQLNNTGTIVLSARDAFFQSKQITSAIQSYLNPKKGSYYTIEMFLTNWEKNNCVDLLDKMDISNAESTFSSLLELIGADTKLLETPFFISKIAQLWKSNSDEFNEIKSDRNELSRINFILEKYIERESTEKWVDTEGNQYLTHEQHNKLLGFIAEEMWGASSYRLTPDELKTACEVALSDEAITDQIKDSVINRIATHAVFQTTDRDMLQFRHDQFYYFYLGTYLGYKLTANDFTNMISMFSDKQLTDPLLSWIDWVLSKMKPKSASDIIANLNNITDSKLNYQARINFGYLLSMLIKYSDDSRHDVISNCYFSEELCGGKTIQNTEFKNCELWQCDVSDSNFIHCNFIDCHISELIISDDTSFTDTEFDENTILSSIINKNDPDTPIHSPALIKDKIVKLGATFNIIKEDEDNYSVSIRNDVLIVVKKIITKSNRFHTIGVSETIDEFGKHVKAIVDIGLNAKIFENRDLVGTRGRKQQYITIQIDKNELLSGLYKQPTDKRILNFWNEIQASFPGK